VAGVRLERLSKSFGRQVVVDVEELDVADGAFFSLLGPSGCGKTTTLRMVAGLEEADAGRVLIGGRDATDVPASARNVGMVFQKHALFPHLTVRENIAFGLRERGARPSDVAARVDEMLALVELGDSADRLPHQLSGGQQQRVALARAAAYRPDVMLLDEPLSSLDVRLRATLGAELKRLQQVLGITTLFVTHDQHEALALSDRIGVMRDGRLEQVGTPQQIYDEPATIFVAAFVGGTNVLAGVVPDGHLAVKPERMRIGTAATHTGQVPSAGHWHHQDNALTASATVESVSYMGVSYSYVVRVGDQRIEARTPEPVTIGGSPLAPGDTVRVWFDRASAWTIHR
jgi:putative spermidine/putrescine transport system ATP-binding protein